MFQKLRPLAPVALMLLAACGGAHKEEAAQPTEAPAASEPAPVAPMTSREASAPPMDAPTGGDAQIDFDLPAGWQAEAASGMRMAQAAIPGAKGPGQLAVFFFGPGGGGTVDANIERWIGQMTPDPGAKITRESFETKNGFRVSWVEVAGTLLPSQMGSGPDTPQPGSLLLGAVVEGPGGPWFFKATGPKETLTAEREHFLEMLRGLRTKA
ncbi:MAG TPA: hypothetical protein DD490_27255 [Acidobacteria bacterium]|nr:hypothetical protein [Acidobacteriota bacterium]